MKNLWQEHKASEFIANLSDRGVDPLLAERTYASRLLGSDSELVLHGGGNTSVKSEITNLFGEKEKVVYIKASGVDLGNIEPQEHIPVELEPLKKLARLDHIPDLELMGIQSRYKVFDSNFDPSLETLLHAILPFRFVDHSHANSILSITNQPNWKEICDEIFENKLASIPYCKPGFKLARAVDLAFQANPSIEGIIFTQHGICTFGDSAKESYERMIKYSQLADTYIQKHFSPKSQKKLLADNIANELCNIAPIIRGAIGNMEALPTKKKWILEFQTDSTILNYVSNPELIACSQRGTVTSDHIVRIKAKPLIAPEPDPNNLEQFKTKLIDCLEQYQNDYIEYFGRHCEKDSPIEMKDTIPRVILVPGLGLFGVGKDQSEAKMAADLAVCNIKVITHAEAVGTYNPIDEKHAFEMEYWDVQFAKLKNQTDKDFSGQVALVTGGSGVLGAAIAQAFSSEGAAVAVLDLDEEAAIEVANNLPGAAIGIKCDVTSEMDIHSAYKVICETWGGIDIIVSNAGAAFTGLMHDMDPDKLRKSFELNFFSHQFVAQQATEIMRAQNTGGVILFNISKQSINPGKGFGAYGIPKAASLSLMKQYALEHGECGIRVNGVNPDRIRSGLLTDEMIQSRSNSRCVSEETYMSGNILKCEVTPQDVAKAFVSQAKQMKTTANIITVDGGNIEASLR